MDAQYKLLSNAKEQASTDPMNCNVYPRRQVTVCPVDAAQRAPAWQEHSAIGAPGIGYRRSALENLTLMLEQMGGNEPCADVSPAHRNV